MPVVIVENDTSQWEDETGAVYQFPSATKPGSLREPK